MTTLHYIKGEPMKNRAKIALDKAIKQDVANMRKRLNDQISLVVRPKPWWIPSKVYMKMVKLCLNMEVKKGG